MPKPDMHLSINILKWNIMNENTFLHETLCGFAMHRPSFSFMSDTKLCIPSAYD